MKKSNLELFKCALNEAVSEKFDEMAAECTEKIVCSEKHKLTMRTIIYGKRERQPWSLKRKIVVAILIAAALLLTGCGIIFRDEIRESFNKFYVSIAYTGFGGLNWY